MLNLFGKKPVKLKARGRLEPLGIRAGQPDTRLPDPVRARLAPGHPVIDGPHYLDVLAALHEALTPQWYLEIGTHIGRSLAACQSNFIAIDPAFKMRKYTFGPMQQGHFMQMTSDDFFGSDFLAHNDVRPDLGFLDGLHLGEALLKDFINFESSAAPGATAILHDCLPHNALQEARDWDQAATGMWTGDVWKVLATLVDLRPDLRIDVLDAYPTGLVVVRDLDPGNDTLAAHYNSFVAEMVPKRLNDFGAAAYFDRFDIQSSYVFIQSLKANATQPKEGT